MIKAPNWGFYHLKWCSDTSFIIFNYKDTKVKGGFIILRLPF